MGPWPSVCVASRRALLKYRDSGELEGMCNRSFESGLSATVVGIRHEATGRAWLSVRVGALALQGTGRSILACPILGMREWTTVAAEL